MKPAHERDRKGGRSGSLHGVHLSMRDILALAFRNAATVVRRASRRCRPFGGGRCSNGQCLPHRRYPGTRRAAFAAAGARVRFVGNRRRAYLVEFRVCWSAQRRMYADTRMHAAIFSRTGNCVQRSGP
jgi:hypothetical protein